ncbi:hypothetical protein GH810_15605 [Acetobacterium paludosum]|uniref:Uncharacterized protein n=1 Tax=Acetobacterium paludosum TaxID=52693 RepID=A0A923I120_9FIRM|nr:hypothetical protein [Acetobacterium paludosum]MBC3889736.1 hypothetical protein [Acetobacterium paludosum]
MEKKKVIELIQEKVKAASFDDKGIAIIPMNDINDGNVIVDVLEDLKKDSTFEFDFDLDKMSLKVYNPLDDMEGFKERHTSPQKCK